MAASASHRLTPSVSIDSVRSARSIDDSDLEETSGGLKVEKERRGRRSKLGGWLRSLSGSGSNSREPSPYKGRRYSGGGSGTAASTRSNSPANSERRVSASYDSSSDETDTEGVVPNNAYEDDEASDSELSDEEVYKNTEANTGEKTVDEVLDLQTPIEPSHDGLPNLIRRAMAHTYFSSPSSPKKRSKSQSEKDQPQQLELVIGKPVFERNRCSSVLTHGNPDEAAKNAKRTRHYFVACDLSEESQYAIEWAIGTVLRDGDECIIASVIETDSKLDPEEANASQADKRAKIANQRERQDTALVIQRIATSLLERTRLHVRVTCQAIHAKNARHMLVDMIDFMDPTMVIIGSRGLSKIKGMLLGSVSHYLVQKSSVPVMVARRRLRRPTAVHRSKASLDHRPRVRSLANAQIEKESHGSAVTEADMEESEKEAPAMQKSASAS